MATSSSKAGFRSAMQDHRAVDYVDFVTYLLYIVYSNITVGVMYRIYGLVKYFVPSSVADLLPVARDNCSQKWMYSSTK